MKPLKIFIENFSEPAVWYADWAPIIVALCALVVSIFALYWSRNQYVNSSRPFVWAIDFAVLNEKGHLIYLPQRIAIRVTNAPAKIIQARYHFYFISERGKEYIHKNKESVAIRFPDEKSQATYDVGDFEQLIEKRKVGEELERYIRIDYSDLSENKKYMYESNSIYDFQEKLWKVISEKAL